MYLPELELEINLCFFSFYWGQRQTIQIKTKISSCGESQRKTVQGQVKDCICFQVLLHDSDVWAKNITILWCLFPSRCECCLPRFIWMPRNVSKLLGFYNIYSAKDKPTFWQPPLNIFRAFYLYICKRPPLFKRYIVVGERFLTFAWVLLIGKCLDIQMNASYLWNFQNLSEVAERWPFCSVIHSKIIYLQHR